jgi:hypothetical protein
VGESTWLVKRAVRLAGCIVLLQGRSGSERNVFDGWGMVWRVVGRQHGRERLVRRMNGSRILGRVFWVVPLFERSELVVNGSRILGPVFWAMSLLEHSRVVV